jgi:hypothetical protein
MHGAMLVSLICLHGVLRNQASGNLTFTLSRKVTAHGLAWIIHVITKQTAACSVSLFRLDVAVTFVQYSLISYLAEAHFNRE